MQDWLRELILKAYDLRDVDPEGKGDLSWAGMPPTWAFWTIVAAVLLSCRVVYRTYRREGVHAGGFTKFCLATLRCGLIGLGLLFLLQPMWLARQTPKEERGLLLVLLDESLSTGVKDDYAGTGTAPRPDRKTLEQVGPDLAKLLADGSVRRIDVLNSLVAPAPDGFELLGKLEKRNHRLKVYAFGAGDREGVRDVALGGAEPPPPSATLDPAVKNPPKSEPSAPRIEPITPVATTTELGSAIRYAYDRHRTEKIAGILVISDGRNVGGARPEDAARELARADIAVPLFAICVGLPDQPPEITVEGVEVNPSYFVKNPINIGVKVRAQGFAGRTVPMRLKFPQPVLLRLSDEDAPRARDEIAATITLKDGHQLEHVPTFEIHEPGRYSGIVEIPVQKGETWDGDNSEVVEFEVRPNIRVLLVGGAATWEFRFLRELYRRQELINVSTWLQSAGADHFNEATTVIARLPTDEAQLSEYDVIVLIDPDPRPESGFTPDWFKTVRKLVSEQGMGFCYVAGSKFTHFLLPAAPDPPAYEDLTRELIELLPIKPDAASRRNKEVIENLPRGWAVTDKGAEHPLFSQLSPRPKELFAALPPFYWHFATTTPKAGATVLATPGTRGNDEAADHVLIAEHQPGKGWSMFLATDDTWRWRARAEDLRRQFWLQLARYLSSGRSVKTGERVRITTDKKLYRSKETVTVTAVAGPAAAGDAGSVEVLIKWKTGEQSVLLKHKPTNRGGPAEYEGFFIPSRDDDYEIFVARESPPQVRRKFKVLTAGAELADITADPARLRMMCRTARVGRPAPTDVEPGWHGMVLVERRGQLYVEGAEKHSPAEAKRGDRIVSVDNTFLKTQAEFDAKMDRKPVGRRTVLGVERDGVIRTFEFRPAEEPNFCDPRMSGAEGLNRLIERVEPVKRMTPTRPKGRPLWNVWPLFALFFTIICIEWVVRKLNRMT